MEFILKCGFSCFVPHLTFESMSTNFAGLTTFDYLYDFVLFCVVYLDNFGLTLPDCMVSH